MWYSHGLLWLAGLRCLALLRGVDQSLAFENQQKDHFAQYQTCTEPLQSLEDSEVCFCRRDSWLDMTIHKHYLVSQVPTRIRIKIEGFRVKIGTLSKEISRASFELQELSRLHIKREGAYAILENSLILPCDGWSSGGKIRTMPVICSKWVQVCTQVWQP